MALRLLTSFRQVFWAQLVPEAVEPGILGSASTHWLTVSVAKP